MHDTLRLRGVVQAFEQMWAMQQLLLGQEMQRYVGARTCECTCIGQHLPRGHGWGGGVKSGWPAIGVSVGCLGANGCGHTTHMCHAPLAGCRPHPLLPGAPPWRRRLCSFDPLAAAAATGRSYGTYLKIGAGALGGAALLALTGGAGGSGGG